LYKEDFAEFNEILKEMTDYIIEQKGEEVISERHQKDFKKEQDLDQEHEVETIDTTQSTEDFTDVKFEDI